MYETSKYWRMNKMLRKYTVMVATCSIIMGKSSLCICVYTFKHSIRISAVNVIVTMFVNESRKNTTEKRMIVLPYAELANLMHLLDRPISKAIQRRS